MVLTVGKAQELLVKVADMAVGILPWQRVLQLPILVIFRLGKAGILATIFSRKC